MPSGKGYRGGQGESGVEPESMNSDSGAYGYSTRRMAPPTTDNMQSYNSEGKGPERAAAVSGPKSAHKSGGMSSGGGDY